MAVKLIEREWRNAVKLDINIYQMDSADDFPMLPEADPGSRALLADKSKKFIVNTAGVWVEDNRPGGFDVGGTGAAELPFGEETTVKEVLAECQPEFVEGEGVFVLMGESDIAVGEKYTVNWNGADYECVAVSAPNNSIALGNMSAMGGDNTGEPFLIAYNIDASAWSFIDMTGSTTLTISIRQEVTEVKKISGKYVEGMGYEEDGVVHPIDQKFIVLTSPNGTQYNLSVADDGTLSAVAAT